MSYTSQLKLGLHHTHANCHAMVGHVGLHLFLLTFPRSVPQQQGSGSSHDTLPSQVVQGSLLCWLGCCPAEVHARYENAAGLRQLLLCGESDAWLALGLAMQLSGRHRAASVPPASSSSCYRLCLF
jgi:hypothetical protein